MYRDKWPCPSTIPHPEWAWQTFTISFLSPKGCLFPVHTPRSGSQQAAKIQQDNSNKANVSLAEKDLRSPGICLWRIYCVGLEAAQTDWASAPAETVHERDTRNPKLHEPTVREQTWARACRQRDDLSDHGWYFMVKSQNLQSVTKRMRCDVTFWEFRMGLIQ